MRKYTFVEAVELMEQGFKMRMLEWSYPPGSYVVLEDMSNFTGVKMFYVFDSSFPTPWRELFLVTYGAMKSKWEIVE